MKVTTNMSQNEQVDQNIPEYVRILKNIRIKNGISQKYLAKLLGYSPMGISHFENGRREMKLSDIEKWASLFHLNVTLSIDKILIK